MRNTMFELRNTKKRLEYPDYNTQAGIKINGSNQIMTSLTQPGSWLASHQHSIIIPQNYHTALKTTENSGGKTPAQTCSNSN